MKHYAGLDVSVKESPYGSSTRRAGFAVKMKVVSHPEDLLAVLGDLAWRLERVGLEAGPLSQGLFSGLAEAGAPAICIETRHAKAVSQGASQQKPCTIATTTRGMQRR